MADSPLTLVFGDPQRQLRVFDLEQPRTATMPIHPSHLPGYSYVLHRRHQDSYGQDGPRTGASGMIVTMEHTGTHIDAQPFGWSRGGVIWRIEASVYRLRSVAQTHHTRLSRVARCIPTGAPTRRFHNGL